MGLLRKIYTTFGGSCSSDHLVGLKRTLVKMTDALEDEKSLITTVNGKTVQLLKITDKLTSRVNTFTKHFSDIDSTLAAWKKDHYYVIMTLCYRLQLYILMSLPKRMIRF